MQDSVIKGTGNSRYLKSVANLLTLYPTYEAFAQALIAGTFPIDLNGVNPAGFQQAGTALNKESLLKDDTAQLYGLAASSALPDGVLKKIPPSLPWKLIASYKKAGAFTYTVPAGVTQLGVYMVGGGGSGGAAVSQRGAAAGGGGSGYGKNIIVNVTPGQKISLVVGAGGEIAAINNAINATVYGKNGGSTSFNGISVEGGSGGGAQRTSNYSEIFVGNSDGGQISDLSVQGIPSPRNLYGCTPAYSRDTSYSYTSQALRLPTRPAREQQNQFDPSMITLCAGGFSNLGIVQVIGRMPDGTGGGTSGALNATGNGNGGAGVSVPDQTAEVTVSSGKGSDGMVLIYKRGV